MSEPDAGGRRRRKRRRRSRWLRLPAGMGVRSAVLGAVLLTIAGLGAWTWIARGGGERAVTGRAYNVARMALGDGDLETALREARTAVDEAPRSREARLLLALVLHTTGAVDEAEALLAEDVRRDPDYDDGRVLLAAFAMREDDHATALTLLREAVARDPTPSGAWRMLGDVRRVTGDLAGAASAYGRAVVSDAGDMRSWLALGDAQLVVAQGTGSVVAREAAGQAYTQAERLCRGRLRGGSRPDLRVALAKALTGRARALRGTSLDDAEQQLRALVAEAGDDVEPTLALAAFLSGVGRVSEARDLLQAAVRRGPVPEARRALARALEAVGDSAEAVAELRRGLSSQPIDVPTLVDLVDLLTRLGRYDEAAELLKVPEGTADGWRVHEAAGDLARVRARAAEAAGDAEAARDLRAAARAAYSRALAGRPRSMPLRKKRFGEVLEAAAASPGGLPPEERAAARAYVADVLALNPADADALAWHARLLLQDGDAEAVHGLLAETAASDAPPLELLRLFAAACERSGRDAQAADAYDRVLARLTHRGDAEVDVRGAPPGVWADAVRSALRAGRAGLAAATAAEAVEAWPDVLPLRLRRAEALLLAARDDDALAVLSSAAGDFPGRSEVTLLEARALRAAGRTADAERVLREALAAGGGADLRFALAALLGSVGRAEEMRAELAAATAQSGDPADAALRSGDVLMALDPPAVEDARARFASAAEAAADPRDALVRLAELAFLDARGDPSRAGAVSAAVARAVDAGVEGAVGDYLEGKLALLEGRDGDAARLLERSAARGRPSAAGLYYLALACHATGSEREAAELVDRAAALGAGDPALVAALTVLRGELAMSAVAEGRVAEALLLLRGGADSPAGTFALATARAARADWSLAEEHLRRYVAERPDDASGRHLLAATLVRGGGAKRLAEAARLYGELVARDPDDAHAQLGLASARTALGDHAAAAAAWDAAARLLPGDAGVLRGRVVALVAAARTDEALAQLDAALDDRPSDAGLLELRGDVLLHAGRAADAAGAYQAACAAARKDVRPLLGAAAALTADGRADEALRVLESGVVRCTEPAPAWRALADLRARAGDVDGARAALARSREPGLPTSYEVLLAGTIAEASGDAEGARRLYESTAREDDTRPATLRRLAALLAAAGETRRALDAVDALLALAPDDAAAHDSRALLLAEDERRIADALRAAARAHELAPGSPEIADTLGWLLVRDGRPAEARALLEQAAAGLAEDPRVRFHNGVCLARLGLVDEARTELERALELDPEFPGADAARTQLERLR